MKRRYITTRAPTSAGGKAASRLSALLLALPQLCQSLVGGPPGLGDGWPAAAAVDPELRKLQLLQEQLQGMTQQAQQIQLGQISPQLELGSPGMVQQPFGSELHAVQSQQPSQQAMQQEQHATLQQPLQPAMIQPLPQQLLQEPQQDRFVSPSEASSASVQTLGLRGSRGGALAPTAPGLPQAGIGVAASTSSAPVPALSLESRITPKGPKACDCDDASRVVTGGTNECRISKAILKEDHKASNGVTGLSFADVSAMYGGGGRPLADSQQGLLKLGRVANTSFLCIDDRIHEPAMSTPGGDLGEFVLALASYLQEKDPTGKTRLTQDLVDQMLLKYLATLPAGRPIVLCTDDRAIRHLEAVLPAENLDLRAPALHAKEAGLLARLGEAEGQGDSHFRLMLKQPQWYELQETLVPMVLSSFYSSLWSQNQDPGSSLYGTGKLDLKVLVGQSSPMAFLEVATGPMCENAGMAPLLVANNGGRSSFISNLDAVSQRRQEMAAFFAKMANTMPQKISKERLHQRLDRHGWLALETTGSHIAAGLPFYTLDYV